MEPITSTKNFYLELNWTVINKGNHSKIKFMSFYLLLCKFEKTSLAIEDVINTDRVATRPFLV